MPTQTQVLGALDAVVGDDDVVINAAGSLPGDLHKLWRARSRASTTWSTATPAWATRSRPPSASSMAAPGPPGVGAGRRRHLPDDADRDRHRRPGGRADQPGPRPEPRLRLHRRPVRGRSAASASAPPTATGRPTARSPATRCPVDLAANAASLGHGRPARQDACASCARRSPTARASDRPTCVYVETDTATARPLPRPRPGGTCRWPRPPPVRRPSRPARSTTARSPTGAATSELPGLIEALSRTSPADPAPRHQASDPPNRS